MTAQTVPGSLKGMAMSGKLITSGPVASYPFRIPMPTRDRVAIMRAGAKVGLGAVRYNAMMRQYAGQSPLLVQQRVYDFEDVRTFADLTGPLPEDAASLFDTVVTRSAGNADEISAGCGIGYFALVFFAGKGLNRNIVGGPSTMTESIAAALGNRVHLGAEVHEIVHHRDSVVVRYTQDGVEHEVEARTAVLATTASVAHTSPLGSATSGTAARVPAWSGGDVAPCRRGSPAGGHRLPVRRAPSRPRSSGRCCGSTR